MGNKLAEVDHIIYCCQGSKCKKRGGKEVAKEIKQTIKENGWKDNVLVIKTLCTGHCKQGPIIHIQPDNLWYKEVDDEIGRKLTENLLRREPPLKKNILFNSRNRE